jgi:hypothetical protein
VIEGLTHQEMANLAGCKKRTIEKWCTQIHGLTTWVRANEKQLSQLQHDCKLDIIQEKIFSERAYMNGVN